MTEAAGRIGLRSKSGLVILLLLAVPGAVYWQVRRDDFLVFDDDAYVTDNAMVKAGLTARGLRWAFTAFQAGNWHPLTWLSHMLDVELFGLDPAGHHLSSLALHLSGGLLLFAAMRRMTHSTWRSGLVAALFALHPLHVESVAWVAERKDVLSGCLLMATLWAYARYTERPGLASYLSVVPLYALGLLAKPMLVSLPFALLLLDVWPLGRLHPERGSAGTRRHSRTSSAPTASRLVLLEKIPLLALATFSGLLTVLAQRRGGALRSLEAIPFPSRIANAIVAYVLYAAKTVWPVRLAAYYPLPAGALPYWEVLGCAVLLLAVSIAVLRLAWWLPYLAVGWFWFLGTLVPVIGIVQVGNQAMADRYTYVPLLGLFVMGVWGGADLAARWCFSAALSTSLAGALLCALAFLTHIQAGFWKDSATLFRHTLEVTTDNWLAEHNYAVAVGRLGRNSEAIEHYRRSLQIKPGFAQAHNNLGSLLAGMGNLDEAVQHFLQAVRLDPGDSRAHNNLGMALLRQGDPAQAVAHFRESVRLDPDNGLAHNNLGGALLQMGRLDEAVSQFHEAIGVNPGDAMAHYNLGVALERQGRDADAIAQFRQALSLDPDDPDARARLEALGSGRAGAAGPP